MVAFLARLLRGMSCVLAGCLGAFLGGMVGLFGTIYLLRWVIVPLGVWLTGDPSLRTGAIPMVLVPIGALFGVTVGFRGGFVLWLRYLEKDAGMGFPKTRSAMDDEQSHWEQDHTEWPE